MIMKRRAAFVMAAVLLIPVAAGCSEPPPTDPQALNYYDPANRSFFKPVQYGASALEAEHYKTLKGAAQATSAIIIAEVIDVHPGSNTEDEAGDVTRYIAIDIRPIEVIKGSLPDQYRDQITVERLAMRDVGRMVSRMRSNSTDGLSVWFLRDKANYTRRMKRREPTGKEKKLPAYRLICSQGLFAQGKNGVMNPLIGHDWGMADEGESYDQLSELVNYLHSVEGWTGKAPRPE
ncbi:MAG: hypothetical protein ACRDQA_04060 [Nocardioidaceae bacterium]